MSYLKTISDSIAKWPKWLKITVSVLLFGYILGLVNPAPVMTPDQKAARTAQEEARKAEDKQKDAETRAVVYGHGWLKDNLNDPDSVEWLGTFVYPNMDICINFSAKNQMGGRVKGYAAIIGGNLTVNNLKAWNKRCGDSGAVRYY